MENIPTTLKAQFLRLYQMAMTDGDFSPLEWKMLYEFATERNISKEELDRILLSTTGYLDIPDSLDEKLEYLYDFAKMIWADNEVTEDERITLKKFCKKFGFLDENLDSLTEFLIQAVSDGMTKEEILNELKS